jgi:hypothetical protein
MFFVVACIFVAILLNQLRKERVMMEDVNVSNAREKWTGCWKRRITFAIIVKGCHA